MDHMQSINDQHKEVPAFDIPSRLEIVYPPSILGDGKTYPDYAVGTYPEVTNINYCEETVGDFFADPSRFPNLEKVIINRELCDHQGELMIVNDSLRELDCDGGKGITGLKLYCKSLYFLAAQSCSIETLDLETPNLRLVLLSKNALRKIKLVLPSVEQLDLSNNRIEEAEFYCPRLRNMAYVGNLLRDFSFLKDCPDLVEITCSKGNELGVAELQRHFRLVYQKDLSVKCY